VSALGGDLIRDARRWAGLAQADLAARAWATTRGLRANCVRPRRPPRLTRNSTCPDCWRHSTEDADITLKSDRANLTRLAPALIELDARIRTDSEPDGLAFNCDADSMSVMNTLKLTTTAGDVDLTFEPAGTSGYDDLRLDASRSELYGVAVQIASLADVIRSKQAANRAKDQRVLPTLREILASRRG
jgi:hypothetical protein